MSVVTYTASTCFDRSFLIFCARASFFSITLAVIVWRHAGLKFSSGNSKRRHSDFNSTMSIDSRFPDTKSASKSVIASCRCSEKGRCSPKSNYCSFGWVLLHIPNTSECVVCKHMCIILVLPPSVGSSFAKHALYTPIGQLSEVLPRLRLVLTGSHSLAVSQC